MNSLYILGIVGILSFLVITDCHADKVYCNTYSANDGTFNGVLPNGNGMLFSFTLTDNRVLISSLNDCSVILSDESKIKKWDK